MATHFSILAWEIPWTEEPGRLQSMGSQKESDTLSNYTHTHTHTHTHFIQVSLMVASCKTIVQCCRILTLIQIGCKIFLPLLLLLSRFSRVRLCVTPESAAHQAPPSLGFSRQEHWSGLPFPSPMHKSEKSK